MTRRTVFVIGATGLVGGAIARRLGVSGWAVSGLARSEAAAANLRLAGVEPVAGDLAEGMSSILEQAASVDAVVLAAQLDGREERALIDALLPVLRGRTLLFISGSGVMLERAGGAWRDASYAEDDDFPVEPLADDRRAAELAVRAGANSGTRTLVVRAGMVWGPGGHGLVPMIYRSVASLGAAGYVGAGRNVYAEVHIDDLTRLVEAALDRGSAGALYHAVGGETPVRWIAEAVARDLDVPTRSLSPVEAEEVWGPFGALIAGATSRIRAPRSHEELGWSPEHHDLLDEIGDLTLRTEAARRRQDRTHSFSSGES
jgi:nucleoside-diphosphate-sugar epimerase